MRDPRWNRVLDLFEAGDMTGALRVADEHVDDYPDVDDCVWRVAFFIRKSHNAARFGEAERLMRRLVANDPSSIDYAQTLYHILYDQDRLVEARQIVDKFLQHADSEIFRELRAALDAAGIKGNT